MVTRKTIIVKTVICRTTSLLLSAEKLKSTSEHDYSRTMVGDLENGRTISY